MKTPVVPVLFFLRIKWGWFWPSDTVLWDDHEWLQRYGILSSAHHFYRWCNLLHEKNFESSELQIFKYEESPLDGRMIHLTSTKSRCKIGTRRWNNILFLEENFNEEKYLVWINSCSGGNVSWPKSSKHA